MSDNTDKLAVASAEAATALAVAGATVTLGTLSLPAALSFALLPVAIKTVLEGLLTFRAARQEKQNQFNSDVFVFLQAKLAAISAEMVKKVDLEEVRVLCEQYAEQAAKEPQRERRRLLAAAAAGSFHPEPGIEEKTRVSRVIFQLEPSDVQALRRIKLSQDTAKVRSEIDLAVRKEPNESIASLIRSGCLAQKVVLEPVGDTTRIKLRTLTEVVPLGTSVLQVLDAYPLPEDSPPQAV